MTDLTFLTILLGLLGVAVIGLFWLVILLERRVSELQEVVVKIELGSKGK